MTVGDIVSIITAITALVAAVGVIIVNRRQNDIKKTVDLTHIQTNSNHQQMVQRIGQLTAFIEEQTDVQVPADPAAKREG